MGTHHLSIDKKHTDRPVSAAGGAPYKEVKYLPSDKCAYPPITAYHKLAAPGPCMGCIRTSAKLQKGSAVVVIKLAAAPPTSGTCVTHLMCLEINASFIYPPNVLVSPLSLLLKTDFLFYFVFYKPCYVAFMVKRGEYRTLLFVLLMCRK